MRPERVEAVLGFIAVADALKHVERAGLTRARRENAAEHSWHVALIAVLLHGEVTGSVDLGRALAMIAAHDLVEIEAGDTFAHDEAGIQTQAAREAAAAEVLFGALPPDLGARLRGLWEEFEAQATPESRFALACDRLQGFSQQIGCGAPAWQEAGLTEARSHRRMNPARAVDPAFEALVATLHARALAAGLFVPGP